MKYSMLGILSRERIPSSAVEIQEIRRKVKEIINCDSSIGISRGAGNCHTEFARTRESSLGFRVSGLWLFVDVWFRAASSLLRGVIGFGPR